MQQLVPCVVWQQAAPAGVHRHLAAVLDWALTWIGTWTVASEAAAVQVFVPKEELSLDVIKQYRVVNPHSIILILDYCSSCLRLALVCTYQHALLLLRSLTCPHMCMPESPGRQVYSLLWQLMYTASMARACQSICMFG